MSTARCMNVHLHSTRKGFIYIYIKPNIPNQAILNK